MHPNSRSTFVLALLLLFPVGPRAQSRPAEGPLPRVCAAAVPLYPLLPHMANIEGIVRVKVITDGHQIVATHVEEGNRLLAAAAEENLRTWRFDVHKQVSFTVIFRYSVVPPDYWKGDRDNPIVALRLPTEVDVSVLRWPPVGDLAPDIRQK